MDKQSQSQPGKVTNNSHNLSKMKNINEDCISHEEMMIRCNMCQKGFSTRDSLVKHLYWCDSSRRITRSRGELGSKRINKNAQPTKSTKSTTKPSKISKEKNKLDADSSSQLQLIALKEPTQISNRIISNVEDDSISQEQNLCAELTHQVVCSDKSDDNVNLASTQQPEAVLINYEFEHKTSVDTNKKPSVCTKCKMTYRNQISLEKHLLSCMYSSSSCSSDDEDESEDESCSSVQEKAENPIDSLLQYENSSTSEDEFAPIETIQIQSSPHTSSIVVNEQSIDTEIVKDTVTEEKSTEIPAILSQDGQPFLESTMESSNSGSILDTSVSIMNTVNATSVPSYEIQPSASASNNSTLLLAQSVPPVVQPKELAISSSAAPQNVFSNPPLPNMFSSSINQSSSETVPQFFSSDSRNNSYDTKALSNNIPIPYSAGNAPQLPLKYNAVESHLQNLNRENYFSSTVTSPYVPSPHSRSFENLGSSQRPCLPNFTQQPNPNSVPPYLSMLQQSYGSNIPNIPWQENAGFHTNISGHHETNPGALSHFNINPQGIRSQQPSQSNYQMISFQDNNGQLYRMNIPVASSSHSLFSSSQLQGDGSPATNPFIQLQQHSIPQQYSHFNVPQQLQSETLAQQQQQNVQYNYSSKNYQLPHQQSHNQMLKHQEPFSMQQPQLQYSQQHLQTQLHPRPLAFSNLQQFQSQSSPQSVQRTDMEIPHQQRSIQTSGQLQFETFKRNLMPDLFQQNVLAQQVAYSQPQNTFPYLQQQQITVPNPQQQQTSLLSKIPQDPISPFNLNPSLTHPPANHNLLMNSFSESNPHVSKTNQPYQIMQMPDGTTYVIVQPPEGCENSNNDNNNTLNGNNSSSQQTNECMLDTRNLNKNGMISYTPVHVPCPTISSNNNFQSLNQCQLNAPLPHREFVVPNELPIAVTTVADKYNLSFQNSNEPKISSSINENSNSEDIINSGFMKPYTGQILTTNTGNGDLEISTFTEKQGLVAEPIFTAALVSQAADIDPSTPNTNINSQTSPNGHSLRKTQVLTAVVRPLEHPLQRMSDQISQIESSFNSATTIPNIHSVAPVSLITQSEILESRAHSEPIAKEVSQEAANTIMEQNIQYLASETHHHLSQDIPCTTGEFPPMNDRPDPKTPTTPTRAGKRKIDPAPTGSPAKSIKLTLKRKEGDDSYSVSDVQNISEIEGSSSGKMRSLKINTKITGGEFAGTSVFVVVVPRIHIVPIPDHDSELGSNVTIAEDKYPVTKPVLSDQKQINALSAKTTSKLTHQVVVEYEVKKDNSTTLFKTSCVRAVWNHIFDTAQGTRVNHNLSPLLYPATNISLENKQGPTTTFSILGLTHDAIQFLLHHLPDSAKNEELTLNKTGCARTEARKQEDKEERKKKKSYEMFKWLASKHRKPLEIIRNLTTSELADTESSSKTNGMQVQIRTLKEKTEKFLTVMWSTIHGMGLYTRRDFKKNDLIIEYSGELVRSIICDQREKVYWSKGIGCYMFRINDEYVIDSTLKGNAARFINHSCDPNCESKSVKILGTGTEHILIYALRTISSGEELTYDYKFEKEDDKHKIICMCGTKKCRKYLN